jgi:eukaryotic-like serine/threonine-protein kinase
VALLPGTRHGSYEIVAAIGAGGMGEVYRGRDTKLGRDVAIKTLPESVAQDGDRLARFDREARTLAALNHPNIAAIYGFEDLAGTKALVLELVEGPTLADRLVHGAIPIEEALPLARQIAEALEAAHEQGIGHRDLKPANVKVRPDGTVKVLDFGLAKAMEPVVPGISASSASLSPTITTPAMTQMGMILGTAAYMAPEQARGKSVDKRADIWAFGCVLYEMLIGRRAFSADEVSDTLALVLMKEPDWSALPPDTPTAISRLLRRCLTKDRQARLPDIGSARLEIDEARAEPQAIVERAGASPRRSRSSALWSLALLLAAALGALATWMVLSNARHAQVPVSRVLVDVAPAERLLSGVRLETSLAQGRPSRTAMAISPDGRAIVFSAEHNGRVQLYLRRLELLEATPIEGTAGASNPFLSPDGEWLGFHADGSLQKVPLAGGPPVVLCKVDFIVGASWSRAGQIIFGRLRGGLAQVSVNGGAPTEVTQIDAATSEYSHRLPHVLPDGTTVLFTITRSAFPAWDDDTTIVAQSLTTGQRKVLVQGADSRFVGTGHLLYVRRGTLMAVPFDPDRIELTGTPVGVVADVMQAAGIQPVQIDTGAGQFAVSDAGSLVYATGGMFRQDRWALVWVDRTGKMEPLALPPGAYLAPRLSPDGTRVTFTETSGDWDIATYDFSRRSLSRLPMKGEQSMALWTPDGSRLAFSSFLDGTRKLMWRAADGSGVAGELTTMTGGRPQTWASDGRTLLFISEQEQARRLWSLSVDGKSAPLQLDVMGSQAELSNDGHWLAMSAGSTFNSTQVYVQPFPSLDKRVQVSNAISASSAAWRGDGREMYYVENTSGDGPLKVRVLAVPTVTSPTFSAGTPRVLFEGAFRNDGPFRGYDVTRDGQRFLMVQEVPLPPARVSQMVLVQNWTAELRR